MGKSKQQFAPAQTYDKVRACIESIEAADIDNWCASEVLRMFRDAVHEGRQPDKRIMEYLANAFTEIDSGTPAETALHLKKRGGRPREIPGREAFHLAALMIDLREQGTKYEAAKLEISINENVKLSAVKFAYDSLHKIIRERFSIEQQYAKDAGYSPPLSAIDLVENWMYPETTE